MKKFRFVLLALGVAAITFAFTPSPERNTLTTVYAFTLNEGELLGSGEYSVLDDEICPGNSIDCAQVWTSKTVDDQPAGTRLANMKKSSGSK